MSLRPPLSALILCSSLACALRPYEFDASATGTTSDTTATTTTTEAPTSTSGSTSAATTSSTSSSSTTGVDGCATEGPPPALECDIWQENCPEGQKCMPWANDGGSTWNALKCTPIDPDPDKVGEPCTVEGNGVSGIDSCEKHAMCWNVDPDTGIGTCVAMCIGTQESPSCANPDEDCFISGDGTLILCLGQCDPILQDCPNDDVCIPHPLGDRFVCVLDASGAEGQTFDPCEYANACDPGLFCADPSAAVECDPLASGCCLPFCDLDEPNTCPGQGQQCVPWYDNPADATSFNTDVGACALP